MKAESGFDEKAFRNPGTKYRGIPFWAWTGKPQKDILSEQIAAFRDMGFGGFFMHSRVGLDVKYLGDEFMDDVSFCKDKAEEAGLYACLYDEDKWPSGFGGGRVTEDETYASRYLLLSPEKITDGHICRIPKSHTRLTDSGKTVLLKTFEITLSDGKLVSWREVTEDTESGSVWYLYLVISDRLDWFNGRQYADVLNRKTADRFLSATYERYRAVLGESFGKTVPAVFHDEPSFKRYETLSAGTAREAVGFPYSDDVEDAYIRRYGESFLENVPELVFARADGAPPTVRYRYFDICAELFSDGFLGPIRKWCDENKIAFTGHFQDENDLELQAKACGDVMRAMSKLTMPGVDILFDSHEYFTLKQAQSVGRQLGRRTAAELYGGTNWGFTLAEHKHEGDWVTALGNSLRVPHLSWMSMKGEMKRDFPASINHCAPWYRKYHLIEDHFARLCLALSEGKSMAKVAVLDPVESMWMLLGPDDAYAEERHMLESAFAGVLEELLFHGIDFDLINEAMLPEYGHVEKGGLRVGEAFYEAVVLPDVTELRKTTASLLAGLSEEGGRIIAVDRIPVYVDGRKDTDECLSFLRAAERVTHEPGALTAALEPYREIRITGTEDLFCRYQRDGDARWLFLAHGKKAESEYEDITVRIKGRFKTELFDTLTGEIRDLPSASGTDEDGTETTGFSCRLYAEDSLLIRLSDRAGHAPCKKKERVKGFPVAVPETVCYEPEEKNVLVLDMVHYEIDGGELQGPEEVLRTDDRIRTALGYTKRSEAMLQPWLLEKKTYPHRVCVQYVFSSETEADVCFALEYADDWTLRCNGAVLQKTQDGYYIDKAIRLTGKAKVSRGRNILEVAFPYGKCSGLEAAYVLGDFGVKMKDECFTPVITAAPDAITFASITGQGFAFYGGNLTYDFQIETKLPDISVSIPGLCGSMAEIALDDETRDVFLTPRNAVFKGIAPGGHRVRIKVFGNRVNTLGPLHNCTGIRWSYGTLSYRTSGEDWTYGYRLSDFGITETPRIEEYEDPDR